METNQFDIVHTPTKMVLFLSRGSHGWRVILNENELIHRLQEISFNNGYKFEIMPHPTNWTRDTQRSMFHKASIVIGLHGGSFANIAFSNNNTTIIEINNGGIWRRDSLCCMAVALQLNYIRFPLKRMSYGSAKIQLTDEQLNSLSDIVLLDIQKKKKELNSNLLAE